jgi:hypothetical protein
MIKDVQGTLKRIDEQITAHNQSIARSRLEIARLQETRLVLMGLAEEDILVAEQAKMERAGLINGQHSVPKLIVRKVGTGDEEGSASKAAKLGLNSAGNRRGMNTLGRKPGSKNVSARGEYRDRVFAALKGGEAMTGTELGDYFGMPRKAKARKPLQNALFFLRSNGQLHRDAEKRYSLFKPSQPQ